MKMLSNPEPADPSYWSGFTVPDDPAHHTVPPSAPEPPSEGHSTCVRRGRGRRIVGLRRALVLAGAETQVMTLWRIDDEMTQQLMAEYYVRIGKGTDRNDAMREVTLKILSNPGTANPKHWASFIVSGDPRPLHRPTTSPGVAR